MKQKKFKRYRYKISFDKERQYCQTRELITLKKISFIRRFLILLLLNWKIFPNEFPN